MAANTTHIPDNLRARHCVCDNAILDEGTCLKCGRLVIPRCQKTGVMVPECGCRSCNRGQLEQHAPHLLAANRVMGERIAREST